MGEVHVLHSCFRYGRSLDLGHDRDSSCSVANVGAGRACAKKSKMKLTKQKLSEMRTKWKANKPKLKACQTDARKKGLDSDDRWFFIEECMNKS